MVLLRLQRLRRGENPALGVDRSHLLAKDRQPKRKPDRSHDACDAAEDDGVRSTDSARGDASNETPNRRCSKKRHRVKGHYTPAEMLLGNGLKNRVCRRHL